MHRVSKVVKLQVVKVDSLHEKKSFLKSLVLKLVFSKKAPKVDEIFTVDLTLTT